MAHKLLNVLICGFKTGFQTGSGFNTVYSNKTNEQNEINSQYKTDYMENHVVWLSPIQMKR